MEATLGYREVLTLTGDRPVCVLVRGGPVWLTASGGGADHFLGEGETKLLCGPGWVLQALGPALIEWTEKEASLAADRLFALSGV